MYYFLSVYPTPVFPVIDGCNHQQYCVLGKQHQDVLTCSVLGIRPKVALEWRAFREETVIDFTQHQLTVTQMGDVYDISLKVNLDFTQTTQNKVTVECRAVGENAELFRLSTKIDLLFPNVLPTEQRSYTSTITIIVVVVTMMMIIITSAVVIICRIRARKMKRNKPGDTENEGIPMMENTNGKTERFIEHLKAKYEIFYDSVQPIPYIKDRMYCVDKVFVEGCIEYMTGISGGQAQWDKLPSYQELVKENCLKTKRQILEGEPGYGKSTLTLQLLYDWCKSHSKTSSRGVDVIIYLRLRQLGGVESIFSAIRQFILPRDSDISEEDIKEILNHMSSVLVLLDGFDEYPDQESTETDIYHIMKKDMFQGFNVILTTRPSCVPTDFAPHSDRVRLTGFGEEARKKYIEKAVVGNCREAVNELLRKLEENPVLDDLCQVPLFFVMFAHMTYEDEHSLTFNSVTSFFRCMISCFHSHMKNKMKDRNVTNFELLAKEHKVLDKIAFEALSGKNQKIVWNREQLRNKLGHEFYHQYLRIGIFVEEEVLNIADTSKAQNHIQYNTEVHFYHKTVCEWYAAHYVAEQLSGRYTACIDKLLKKLDPFDLQYLYRFACGLNKIAGEKIIQYLQKKKESTKFAILCMLEHGDKTDRFLKLVSDLVSSEETYIRKEDSKLLQRSTLQILDVASKNQLKYYKSENNEIIAKEASFHHYISTIKTCFQSIRNPAVYSDLRRSANYHLNNIRRARKMLTTEAAKLAAHTLVTSRLDYCNSLLIGVNKSLITKLQNVQRTSARIIAKRKKYDSVTSELIALHWLPMQQRIKFKVLLLVYKAHQKQSPSYISDLLQLQAPRRQLRSHISSPHFTVPRTSAVSLADRSFSCYGPKEWNTLPFQITSRMLRLFIFSRNCSNVIFFKKCIVINFM
ncbi:hypothetical protein BSL78_20543 [Apostichopus japonicus]|uniref:NACHT domain-containing protein n=1 Tax=Stichopus japonicus TaxID=307972 RepID=A0A2G8K3N6_STIJA|nr:hypothetical protein BSL78_20543 [Apostichopus japonicus]